MKQIIRKLQQDKTEIAGDLQGLGLNLLTRFASSDLPDQLGIREPVEKALYEGSKASFKFLSEKNAKAKQAQASTPKSDAETAQWLARKKRGLFSLALTEEQQMMRDMLRSFATEMIRPAAHDADHDHKTPTELLTQLHELGLAYQAVPEKVADKTTGGMANAQSTVSQMLSLEDLGFGDFSIAANAASSVSVANVIRRYGSVSQQQYYLPKFLADEPFFASLATNERTPLFNPKKLSTTVKKTGSLYVLTGEKNLVINAENAEVFVVSAMYNAKPCLFLVEAKNEHVKITPEPAMGLKAASTCRVRFNGVRLLENARLETSEAANYQEFLDLSRLAVAALACGVGDAVLDYVIPYVNEREAFGEPISHRQSVAFMVSDIAIELEAMRMLVWRAVAKAQNGLDFHREAHLAHVFASEKSMEIGTNAVQLLGGHGYTKEHPVERWYRDLRSVSALHGSLCL